MITDLKPYPAYKESGVQWLGEVPEGWEVRRLKYAFEPLVNGVWGRDPDGINDIACVRVADFDRERLITKTPIPTMRAVSVAERRRRLLRRGDLLLEKSGGGTQQPVGVVVEHASDISAISSNFVARMRPRRGLVGRYLTYLHFVLYSRKVHVRSIKQTTGIQNLDGDAYLGERVPLASRREQMAIVRFLDHADSRIHQAIKAKERLIGLLNEEIRVIVHRVVTCGLNSHAQLKPSGIEWLGDLPAHWQVRPLRYLARFHNGYAFAPADWGSDGTAIIRIANLNGSEEFNYTSREDVPEKLRIRQGDLLFAWSGNRGTSFGSFVWDREFDGYLNQHIFKVDGFDLDAAYFGYLLRAVTRHVEEQAHGIIGMVHITKSKLGSIRVPIAPPDEQGMIARAIDEETGRVSAIQSRARREITLLREFRTRLISDVVTGKLDVREAAANLPDDPDHDDLALDERLEEVVAG